MFTQFGGRGLLYVVQLWLISLGGAEGMLCLSLTDVCKRSPTWVSFFFLQVSGRVDRCRSRLDRCLHLCPTFDLRLHLFHVSLVSCVYVRSPNDRVAVTSIKVLLGLPYDGAIDIWSLGCISVEMFLGLPIFPGVSDHNQICRIVEMTGSLPEFMLENGKDTLKFFKRVRCRVRCFHWCIGPRRCDLESSVGFAGAGVRLPLKTSISTSVRWRAVVHISLF